MTGRVLDPLAFLATRRLLATGVVAVLPVVLAAGLALIRLPDPFIQDEFGHLLAADTFRHGRITNRTHPLWVHFETLHINHVPTYQSKYPPAQGLILAVGDWVGGHPIVGVWLSAAFACAALYWMLQAWLPPRWALYGGLLAAIHPLIIARWSYNYWGGLVAMAGGALVFGALRRILRRPTVPHSLVLVLGLAILANSRPFEGLLASLPAAGALLHGILGRQAPPLRVSLTRLVAPVAVGLALCGVVMGLYNARSTGDALRMPYQVHEATYAMGSVFFWTTGRPEMTYRHASIEEYYRWRLMTVYQHRDPRGLVRMTWLKVKALWRFYFGLPLTIPLLMLPLVLRGRWMQFAAATCAGVVATLLATTIAIIPHYIAPLAGLLFVLVVQSVRHLRLVRLRGVPVGRWLALSIPFLLVASTAVRAAQRIEQIPRLWSAERARILANLEADPDRHLVVVRYGPDHVFGHEWVYNEADIDAAEVVWAREMKAEQNRNLLDYFPDRRVWLLEIDNGGPLTLRPYAVDAPRTGPETDR